MKSSTPRTRFALVIAAFVAMVLSQVTPTDAAVQRFYRSRQPRQTVASFFRSSCPQPVATVPTTRTTVNRYYNTRPVTSPRRSIRIPILRLFD